MVASCPEQEEPSDLVMVCALYSSVNMEMEVIKWKEKWGGGWINDRKINTNEGEKSGKGRKDLCNKICNNETKEILHIMRREVRVARGRKLIKKGRRKTYEKQ